MIYVAAKTRVFLRTKDTHIAEFVTAGQVPGIGEVIILPQHNPLLVEELTWDYTDWNPGTVAPRMAKVSITGHYVDIGAGS